MLNAIKSMINRKRDFLESADIILEDMADEEINDMVTDVENSDSSNEYEDKDNDDSENDKDEDDNDYESDDVYQSDDSDEDSPDHTNEMDNSDDADLDDIFNVSIDMRSNTFSDILPTPPPNASDAISGDVSSMKLDSGFGDEPDIMNEPIGDSNSSDDNIMDEPLSSSDDTSDSNIMDEPLGSSDDMEHNSDEEDVGKEEADPMAGFQDEHVEYRRPRSRRTFSFFEAITDGSDPNAAPPADDSSTSTDTTSTTPPPSEPPEESEVTSAVKDNVNTDTDQSSDSSTDYSSSDSSSDSSTSGGSIDKKGLFKKLTGLQKSIDDIKGSIIDSF